MVPVEDILAAPDEAISVENGNELLSALSEGLGADYASAGSWHTAAPSGTEPFGDNGYGGASMLVFYTSSQIVTEATISPDEWNTLMAKAEDIAKRFGFQRSEQTESDRTAWRSVAMFENGLESVEVGVQDARLDSEQSTQVDAHGGLAAGISLIYRSTTIADEKRPDFEEAARPYEGRQPPRP